MSYCLSTMQSLHYTAIFFFFKDPPTSEIYTLSLHDALPISGARDKMAAVVRDTAARGGRILVPAFAVGRAQELVYDLHRSEEHTSELQSRGHLVCRLLLEKKNTTTT